MANRRLAVPPGLTRCERCELNDVGDYVMVTPDEVNAHSMLHARWCFSFTPHAGHGVCDGYPRKPE